MKAGDYVFIDGEYRKIVKLHFDNGPLVIDLENSASYYVQLWMKCIPGELYESPLWKALR